MRMSAAVALLLALAATATGPSTAAPPAFPGSLHDWNYALSDKSGRSVRLADWKGSPAIVAMDHTGSAVICSDTSRRLRALQTAADRLGKRFEFIVISLDPATDTPAGWQSYLRSISLPDAKWHFLRPSAEDARAIAQRLGVKHWLQDGFLVHDVMITRIDERGRVVRRLTGYDRDSERFLR